MSHEIEALRDQERIRREAFVRQVADTLRRTVRVIPKRVDDAEPDVIVELTDASVRVLAPLVEAVLILEAIIWASDGCVGHRNCAHSMEPWQRARALLAGKWQAYEDRTRWPSSEESPSADAVDPIDGSDHGLSTRENDLTAPAEKEKGE